MHTVQVVISKLRMNQGAVSDHFHLRAAKALVVIVPLLGITYIILIVGPREADSVFSIIFISTRSVLLSFQVVRTCRSFTRICSVAIHILFYLQWLL